MRVTTLIIIIAIIVGGLWYANKEGYIGKAKETADSFDAHYAAGTKLYNDMKYDEAIAEYEKAMARDSNNVQTPILMRRLGDCYKEKGDSKKAISIYEDLCEKYPDHKIVPDTKNAIEKVRSLGHF